jgi:putative glycoprotease GCP
MKILAFETSCDETSVAAFERSRGVVAERTRSQMVHATYGGVVPELAAREHLRILDRMTREVLEEAGWTLEDVDLFAATRGPGLIGALLVGHTFARTLACITGRSFRGVHHLVGHLYSPALTEEGLEPPFLALIVSGGHTELVWVEDWLVHRLLGQTRDDAAGEAFDKVAKMMNLGYPGGPRIEALARTARNAVSFPRARVEGLDFSFSGIKTAVLYWLRDHPDTDPAEVARGFQEAVVGMLMEKLNAAWEQHPTSRVVIAGGVARNGHLRETAQQWAQERDIRLWIPAPRYCMDNAAMIAWAADLAERRGCPPTDPLASPSSGEPLPEQECVHEPAMEATRPNGS